MKSLGNPVEAINIAREQAPYLDRLAKKSPELLEKLQTEKLSHLLGLAANLAVQAADFDMPTAMRDLRIAKANTHFLLAAGDLSQTLKLEAITKGLSTFADICVQTALNLAQIDASPRDAKAFTPDGNVPGLFIIAMGKHGAGELNYSSDIDLVACFDREAFAEDYQANATAICVRIIGATSRILEEVTPDNYVFRVDWRLRPDPSSTPVAVSTQAAEAYYESVGQNWERGAYIKSRAIAGSMTDAALFLNGLVPFIWRKYLDFAAIADVSSILQQIHRVNRSGDFENPAFDLKLGRGGIREIEFFTQTQQLILGGRDNSLREPSTVKALQALVVANRIYLAELDTKIRNCREMVRTHISELFPQSGSLSSDIGSLVFTGVENDAETLETISQLGFENPQRVSETIRGWHHGRIRATRTPRARELLTALTPTLLKTIANCGEADVVFARFDDFFSGLSAGVQTLSLFIAEPEILAETCKTLALSSRLANALSKKPAILDAMLTQRFGAPLEADEKNERKTILQEMLANCDGFEAALDVMRRFHREEDFRIGCQTIRGQASGEVAGDAYSDLAIACIDAALTLARRELVAAHGEFAGEIAVCGWGKLGGHELSADSDLDIMLIYDPIDGGEASNGARSLSAESYFAKLTQKLVLALSAPTAEGQLYEVDMQLRPSGKKGPVAVRFASFENYYLQDAWTWELQALTRLRPVAGDENLCKKIEHAYTHQLSQVRDANKTLSDIVEMRGKISGAMKPRGPLDLKRLDGGIIDLEFFTQAHLLLNANSKPQLVSANTIEALHNLAANGILNSETAHRLIDSGRILLKIRQLLAIIGGVDFDPKTATHASLQIIADALDAPDFANALAIIDNARAIIAHEWKKLASATEFPTHGVECLD
ncbi:MAG: glutamate-ammonia-ligase adenylyltransferase [Hyphomonadaceae bacterium]|nr:MAG: glutamate-ammonia-ligase adenylyltransferase [Hyphomonadaceae bacterium]